MNVDTYLEIGTKAIKQFEANSIQALMRKCKVVEITIGNEAIGVISIHTRVTGQPEWPYDIIMNIKAH